MGRTISEAAQLWSGLKSLAARSGSWNMDYFEPLILCTKQEPEWEKSRQCSPKRKKVDMLRLFKRKVTS